MKLENRNRSILLALAGGYLIYLAYEMMRDELAGKSSMAMWLCILLTILMGVGGIGVLLLAWKVYRTKEPEETEPPEDTDNIK